MNLNVYRFMLKLFLVSYTSFISNFLFSSIFSFVVTVFSGCAALYIAIMLSRSLHELKIISGCVHLSERMCSVAAEAKNQWISKQNQQKSKTENHFVRLNCIQGVAAQ